MRQRILFIITGGTIDEQVHPVISDYIATPSRSLIPETVQRLPGGEECDFLHWTMKKSDDFTRDELVALADLIKNDPHDHIVVTHGTNRLPENSRTLQDLLEGTN